MKNLIEMILGLFSKSENTVDKKSITAYVEENVPKVVKPIIKPVLFKKDSTRLIKEYKDLKSKNKELHEIIESLNVFTQKTFKKRLVITMIYRTQAEQDFLYKNSAKYAKRKFKSPHQFWHSVDVRSRSFTEAEIIQMVNFLNKNDNKNYYKWTAKNHTVGHGMHFHIQFIKK